MEELIQKIVKQSKELKDKYVNEYNATLSYCCIFSQTDEQYNEFENQTIKTGRLLAKTKTGNLYQINPMETVAGTLKILKIRKPDVTRKELGDCDFKLDNYSNFKEKFLSKEKFKLIERENFEMIELMDNEFNVRVYFSNPPVEEHYELLDKIEMLNKVEKVLYITQASPVVLVSTIDNKGIYNLAPIGMFMNCSSKDPQMVAIAVSNKADTYRNIKETKQFVIGIPKEEMLDKLYKAGDKVDKDIDEFQYTGLTPYNSSIIKAKRIKECAVNIECVYENELETGNHNIIVGKIVACDIEEKLYAEDKVQLRLNIPNIYHLTSNKFLVDNELKEV